MHYAIMCMHMVRTVTDNDSLVTLTLYAASTSEVMT